MIAQSLYAAGAALCFINTWVSIAAIVLVQLNYALAPRLWWRKPGHRTTRHRQGAPAHTARDAE